MRTIPGISHMLKPLDDAIDIFIKVLLQGYAFNPTGCVLFSLPAKYGGMGLIISSEIGQEEFGNSQKITTESTNTVISNKIQFQDNRLSTAKIKGNIKNKRMKQRCKLQEVKNKTSIYSKLRSIEASTENGASI